MDEIYFFWAYVVYVVVACDWLPSQGTRVGPTSAPIIIKITQIKHIETNIFICHISSYSSRLARIKIIKSIIHWDHHNKSPKAYSKWSLVFNPFEMVYKVARSNKRMPTFNDVWSSVDMYNIIYWHWPSKYNNGMLGAQTEFESPCATFQASNCYILRVHITRTEH